MVRKLKHIDDVKMLCVVCNKLYIHNTKSWSSRKNICFTCHNKKRKEGINRFFILKRDNFKCIYCGKSPLLNDIHLEIDHIIPVSQGGNNTIDNLATSCMACNREKTGNYDKDNFKEIIDIIKKRNK